MWISHVKTSLEAEGQPTMQRSPWYIKDAEMKASVSWKSSQFNVALCLEYDGDMSRNRCLAGYLNSVFAATQSGEIWPWKVNFKFAYTKFCDCTMELSMLSSQWKSGIPTTGSSWDKRYCQNTTFHEAKLMIKSYASIKALANCWPIRHFRTHSWFQILSIS